MAKKIGKYTLRMNNPPSVIAGAAIGSKKEGEGPLSAYFDIINPDSSFGEKTWEKAESRLQKDTINKMLEKAGIASVEVDAVFGGDLLNQCVGTTFGMREIGIPLFGLFSACATFAEAMALAALLVDADTLAQAAIIASSHFCSAERQFRFPLEYGGQRPPSSQWTATAAGAALIGTHVQPPYIKHVTIGIIEDLGVTDANNMGAAMAPSAAATLTHFFSDTGTNADNYDLILSGDLGAVGSELLYQLMERGGYDIRKKHADCGLMIFDRDRQDVHAGASGAGCAAAVFCAYILPSMREGKLKNLLFIPTGALLSPTTVQQGESIPCICHLIHLADSPEPAGV